MRSAGHDLAIGELVIAAQQRRSAEPIGEENREEVIVVAELQLLRAGVRRFRLERWRLLEKRVAQADDRAPAVVDWQEQRVDTIWRWVDRLKLQAAGWRRS